MKGLKEFLEALKENKVLFSEVEKVQDNAAKVVEIAKKHGYSFTEDEYMDAKMDAVSGGAFSFGDLWGATKDFAIGKTVTTLNQMGMTSEDKDYTYTYGENGRFRVAKNGSRTVEWQINGSDEWNRF